MKVVGIDPSIAGTALVFIEDGKVKATQAGDPVEIEEHNE